MSSADALTDMWIDLAEGQWQHGSHLATEENRGPLRSTIARHIVSGRVRVARGDGRLLGFVMFSVESGTLERTVTRGLIENLYVIPERRRHGIGTALLEAAEKALAESGVDTVTLEVLADNDSARSFYDTHGYDPHRLTVEKAIESDTH
ncbi:GNAT family N-acetyltransferase [Halorhabdus rudnickae]|uniref:GNAT family N-acetyltransferase n=1 Tax=Halorhabdus rudnickae TaxID=1775544 RepID=UPI001082D6A3|nr:GNAT family N-acetyltransferase [Halorhabdus rudnickae]